jgi:hypothetical protein
MPLYHHHSVETNPQPDLEVDGSVDADPADNYSEQQRLSPSSVQQDYPWLRDCNSFSLFGLLGFPIGLLLAFLMQLATLGVNFLVLAGSDVAREDFMHNEDVDDDMQYAGITPTTMMFQERFNIVLFCSLIIHALMIVLLYLLRKVLQAVVVVVVSSCGGACCASTVTTTRDQPPFHQRDYYYYYYDYNLVGSGTAVVDQPHTGTKDGAFPTPTTVVHDVPVVPAPNNNNNTPPPPPPIQAIVEFFVLQGLLIGLWMTWMAADPTVWGVATATVPVAIMMMLMMVKRARQE